MITIYVELSSQLKSKAAYSPSEIQVQPPCSLKDCIQLIADECGEEFKRFIFTDSGSLRSTILLSVNDMQMFWEDYYLLSNNDRVSILSPIAGGLM